MLEQLTDSLLLIVSQTKHNLPHLEKILLIPWCIFFITRFIFPPLLVLGITPRRLYGLPGVIFAPLLHANFNHLFYNSIPLLVLSNFILIQGLAYFIQVSIEITLLSGLLIWCLASPGLYIGASALITGYWGLLVIAIYQQGTITSIILGLLSLYYFIGIFAGIFPGDKGASWQGHLYGLVAGLFIGYTLH